MKAPYLGLSSSRTRNLTVGLESFTPNTSGPVPGDDLETPLYTGRYFLIFEKDTKDFSAAASMLNTTLNTKVASSSDFQNDTFSEEKIADADAFIYEELGVALVSAEQHQVQAIQQQVAGGIARIEPEMVVYAIPFEATEALPQGIAAFVAAAAPSATWGISATGSDLTTFTGQNVRVAILDTGLDLTHPDFAGRVTAAGQSSFVPGIASVQDLHGHGTHCTGIACGNSDPTGVRYGVAGKSDIYIGKVLDNTGRGAQSWILNGISWAAANQCKVISMSLGSRVFPGLAFVTAYERAIASAVAKGSLVVVAAGNDSSRSTGVINPVGSPGNCPSAIAVTAVDIGLKIADFANGSINPGQDVFIGGPGVNVLSSWPMPTRYRSISGTSMATPFVAGVSALICEMNPGFTPAQVKGELSKLAQSLPLPLSDIGCGLVKAP